MWSVIEIFLVAVCLVYPRFVLKFSLLLTIAFSFLLVFEYTTFLGPSPNFMQSPWSQWNADVQAWFTLGATYNLKTIYADFFCALLVSYLYKSHFLSKGSTPKPSDIEKLVDINPGLKPLIDESSSLRSFGSMKSFASYHSLNGEEAPISEETIEFRVSQAGTSEETKEIAMMALQENEVDDIMKTQGDLRSKKSEIGRAHV